MEEDWVKNFFFLLEIGGKCLLYLLNLLNGWISLYIFSSDKFNCLDYFVFFVIIWKRLVILFLKG